MDLYRKIDSFPEFEMSEHGIVRHIDSKNTLKVDKQNLVTFSRGVRRNPEVLLFNVFPEKLPGVIIDDFKDYSITMDGRIFSIYKRNFRPTHTQKRHKAKNQDEKITLQCNGKRQTVLVHRLIAKAYLPNPNNLPEVNHKDGNSLNNDISNLEWVSKIDNTKHAVENYLFEGQQKKVLCWKDIDEEPTEFISMQQAADVLKMQSKNANKNISECCTKNASDKLNRGKSTDTNPFRTEGYAFRYNNK